MASIQEVRYKLRFEDKDCSKLHVIDAPPGHQPGDCYVVAADAEISHDCARFIGFRFTDNMTLPECRDFIRSNQILLGYFRNCLGLALINFWRMENFYTVNFMVDKPNPVKFEDC